MNLGRWAVILLLIVMACALAGFLIDTVRVIAGFLFVVCVVVLIANFATKKRS